MKMWRQYVQKNEKGEGEGRGGMKSKLKIAKETARKDIPTFIANGKQKNVIVDIIRRKRRRNTFLRITQTNYKLERKKYAIDRYKY